ncbi:MAG: hypothetical protein ACLRXQ_05405 [Phascolarctobacterium faecium]
MRTWDFRRTTERRLSKTRRFTDRIEELVGMSAKVDEDFELEMILPER